jgi:hypothetical protein
MGAIANPAGQPASVLRRLPNRAEAWTLYAAVSVPLHTWAAVAFFYQFPAFILRLTIWQTLATGAYLLVAELIESLLAFGFVCFVALALPDHLFKRHIIAQGVWGFGVMFVWLIAVHFQAQILAALAYNFTLYYALVTVWIASLLAVLLGGSLALRRRPALAAALTAFADRLGVLAGLYLALDVVSVIVVAARLLV